MLALGALFAPLPLASASPIERVIGVRARSFAFTPERIRINRGDRVTLILNSEDVTHGLYLDGYNVNLVSQPGVSQRATFTAERTGVYRFRCSVSCGTLHPFMIGEMEVAPNTRTLRSALLAIVAAFGTVAFLWAREVRPGGTP